MLLLALSCLQGRPQQAAFDELVTLIHDGLADGIQLTPGNQPTPDFRAHVVASGVPVRFHHAFSWNTQRRPIYAPDGRLAPPPILLDGSPPIPWSVHPPLESHATAPTSGELRGSEGGTSADIGLYDEPGPRLREAPRAALEEGARERPIDLRAARGAEGGDVSEAGSWSERLTRAFERGDVMVEVMPPGHRLGAGDGIREAIERGWRLAVDVSHLFQQRAQNVLDEVTLTRLLAYDHVGEVHVSGSDGRHDLHRPLVSSDFGLGWARERRDGGTCVVLECYMHRLSWDERREQLEVVRAG